MAWILNILTIEKNLKFESDHLKKHPNLTKRQQKKKGLTPNPILTHQKLNRIIKNSKPYQTTKDPK